MVLEESIEIHTVELASTMEIEVGFERQVSWSNGLIGYKMRANARWKIYVIYFQAWSFFERQVS